MPPGEQNKDDNKKEKKTRAHFLSAMRRQHTRGRPMTWLHFRPKYPKKKSGSSAGENGRRGDGYHVQQNE